MTKVILEKVFRTEKDYGKGPAQSVGLKIKNETVELVNGTTVAVNGRWMNLNKLISVGKPTGTETWEEGMEVEVKIVEKPDKKDPTKLYLNYEPKGFSLEDKVSDLEERVTALENK